MSEGPVNFGKPLFFLVLAACIGGGVYMWMHWPVTYESKDGASYYSIDFPHAWTASPNTDPGMPTKVVASGPLPEETQGVGWTLLVYHGTLDWPGLVVRNIPGTPDVQAEADIDHKKSMTFEYQDNDVRYIGGAVDRGDALVMVAIGTSKANFEQNRLLFEKVIKSIKCSR